MKRTPPKGFEVFVEKVEGLEWSHHDAWRGRCPRCKSTELLAFENGLEVKCLSCHLWTFGIEEFIQKFLDEAESVQPTEFAKPHPELACSMSIKEKETLNEGRADEAPGQQCRVCGKPLEIVPHARRKRIYCSGRCRQKASRERKGVSMKLDTILENGSRGRSPES